MLQSPGKHGTLDNGILTGHVPGIALHELDSVEVTML